MVGRVACVPEGITQNSYALLGMLGAWPGVFSDLGFLLPTHGNQGRLGSLGVKNSCTAIC